MVGSRGLSLQWGRISWFHPSCCLCYLPVSPKPCHINDFPTLYFSCSAPKGPSPKPGGFKHKERLCYGIIYTVVTTLEGPVRPLCFLGQVD